MEPVSLVASICTLAAATHESIKWMKSYKDGNDEIAELLKNVSLLEDNLKNCDRIFRSRQMIHQSSAATDIIEESSRTLKDLERRILEISRYENPRTRRMKWVQHKSNFEKDCDRIKEKCQMLVFPALLCLNPQFLEICSTAAADMEMSSSPCRPSSTVQSSPRSPMPPLLRSTSDESIVSDVSSPKDLRKSSSSFSRSSGTSQQILSDTSSNVPSFGDTQHLGQVAATRQSCNDTMIVRDREEAMSSRSSASSVRSSVFSSCPSAASSSILVPDSHGDDVKPSTESAQEKESERISADSLIIRRACRFDCYCQCHSQSIAVSSDAFPKPSASIFREDKAPKSDCTEPDCAGSASSQKRIPPSAFLKRVISTLVSAQSVKARYSLNTYRMVPEGSNAMRYVKHGNLDMLKLSVRMGETTPWDTAPDGWSLLHTAAYAGQLPTVKYLCELGANTEVADLGARKPVDLAILKSLTAENKKLEEEIVRIISKENDYLHDFEFTPIHIAVLGLYDLADSERPSLEQLIEFLDDANNASPGTNWARWKHKFRKRSPLFMAIIEQFRVSAGESQGRTKVVHNLLDQKDRKFHWTPLHWASATNRAEKMKVLVHNGADPFIQSNLNANIFHAAVESNALQSLSYALEIYKSYPERLDINQPNVWGESPLIMAAQGCRVDCVRLLLEAGADRSIRQENQQVALHYAGLSKRGNARRETVALLCSGDHQPSAHINAQDEDGRPPLFDFLDDWECMELLIRRGARLDLLDKSRKSVLHHACIQDEDVQLITLLRRSTTSVLLKEKDNDGNTALIEALRHGSVGCAMTLLELDDVGDIVGQGGWAAVHYAAKLGNPDLLEMVLKHPSFKKNMKTEDGTTAQDVAKRFETWSGRVKELLKKYNSII